MADELKPTDVEDVQLPQVLVELKHLRTKSGNPVVVTCEALDDLTMAKITGGLSGARDPGLEGEDPVAAAGGIERMAELTDERAQALIGRATWFLSGTEEVRPAFWFDSGAPRHARSIPGRLLRYEDRLTLLTAILRVGNYLSGGVADATSFPIHAEGVGDGVGAGASGREDESPGVRVAGSATGDVASRGWPLDAGEGEGVRPD